MLVRTRTIFEVARVALLKTIKDSIPPKNSILPLELEQVHEPEETCSYCCLPFFQIFRSRQHASNQNVILPPLDSSSNSAPSSPVTISSESEVLSSHLDIITDLLDRLEKKFDDLQHGIPDKPGETNYFSLHAQLSQHLSRFASSYELPVNAVIDMNDILHAISLSCMTNYLFDEKDSALLVKMERSINKVVKDDRFVPQNPTGTPRTSISYSL